MHLTLMAAEAFPYTERQNCISKHLREYTANPVKDGTRSI
jgi:hypothetical protein